MKTKRFFVLAAMLSLGVLAETYYWKGNDGLINDPLNYATGMLPGAGDIAAYDVSGKTYTVLFPSNAVYSSLAREQINANGAGHSVTFDGRSADWYPADQDEAVYNAEPIKFYSCGGCLLDLEDYWGDAANRKKYSPFRFTNFVFKVSAGAELDKLEFVRGMYHFDYGNSKTRKNLLFAYGWSQNYKPLEISAGAGTEITFVPILWSVRGCNSVLRFTGGHHVQKTGIGDNDFSYRNYDVENAPSSARMELFGEDTSFTFNSVVNVGNSGFTNRTFTFQVADGAKLVFNKKVNAYSLGNLVFNVENGGMITANGGEFTTDNRGFSSMVFNDSTFKTVTNDVFFGGTTETIGGFTGGFTNSVLDLAGPLNIQKEAFNTRPTADVSFKNCSLDSVLDGQLRVWGGNLTVEDSEFDLKGGLFVHGGNTHIVNSSGVISNIVAGAASGVEEGHLVIDGGDLSYPGMFCVGYKGDASVSFIGGSHEIVTRNPDAVLVTAYTQSPSLGEGSGTEGTLTISGDDTKVTLYSKDNFYVGNNGKGNFNMLGGSLAFTKWTSIYAASQPYSAAKIRIAGGRISASNVVLIGTRGNVDILQSGGSVTFEAVRLGSFARGQASYESRNPMVYKITGGELDAGNEMALAGHPGYDCSLIFDGGIVSTKKIYGGNGSSWNGADGSSTLSADGGVLRPKEDTAAFISNLDLMEVGTAGLVIDTDYDVTVSQSIVSKAGVSGKLIKTGSGTLTLSGEIAEDVTVEVREGDVVFSTENAMKGSLVVITKGEAYFTAGTTLTSLEIGNENSAGGLVLGDDVTLVVTGAVNRVKDGSVSDSLYTVDPVTGATTIVKDPTEAQNLLIKLDAGVSNATENLSFKSIDTLELNVAAGAALTASGTYSRGKLVKTGGGKAIVDADANLFINGIDLENGMLSFGGIGSLGMGYSDNSIFTQKSGTLEYTGEAGTLYGDWTISAPETTNAVVVKIDTDLTVSGKVEVVSGALIKRGAGKLTIVAAEDTKLASSVGVTPRSGTASAPMVFDSDGTPPTAGYGGFNIAGGEVELRGPAKYTIAQSGMIGCNTSQETASPVLTLKGTEVALDKSAYLFGIGTVCNDSSVIQTQKLNVIDSILTGDTTLVAGWGSYSSKQRVEVLIDNSTVNASYYFWFNENRYTTNGAYYTIRNNSKLKTQNGARIFGRTCLDFFDSSYSGPSSGCVEVSVGNKDFSYSADVDLGYMRFRGDSVLYVDRIKVPKPQVHFSLFLDGAVWETGSADTALKVNCAFGSYDPSNFKIVLEEGGVTFPVAEDDTLTAMYKIEGEGGLTKTGAGTMVFDTWTKWNSDCSSSQKWSAEPVTWAFDGEANVAEGTLVLKDGAVRKGARINIASGAILQSDGAVLTNAVLRGAGTVTGGTLVNCTVKAPLRDEAVAEENLLSIQSAVIGRLYFDFDLAGTELESPYPENVVVAKWTGVKPDVSAWRSTGLGGNLKAEFTANDDGTVTATVGTDGMFLLIK